MSVIQVLVSQLHFLVNRNSELAVLPFILARKLHKNKGTCIDLSGHVATIVVFWLFTFLWLYLDY